MDTPITPGYYLRRLSISIKRTSITHLYQQYLQTLRKQGLFIHPSIHTSVFQLENGLQYHGISTDQDLPINCILAKVPRQLILNTFHAYFSPLQQIFKQKYQYFNTEQSEDRVLIVFLMWIHLYFHQSYPILLDKEMKQNKIIRVWHQMIQFFSKQINILQFWQKQQLQRLQDDRLVKRSIYHRDQFNKQFQQVKKVLQLYPQFFRMQDVQLQTYRWLYVHLTSRAFGKNFEYYAFVPFVQYFNHSLSDTCYSFVKQGQGLQQQQRFLSQKQIESICTSQQSYNEEDMQFIEDYDYSKMRLFKVNWDGKSCINYDEKVFKGIKTLLEQIEAWIYFYLDWKDPFSFIFSAQIVQQLRIIESSFKRAAINQKTTKQKISKIKQKCQQYKQQMIRYFTQRRHNYTYDSKNFGQQNLPFPFSNKQKTAVPFKEDQQWKKQPSTSFAMHTYQKDNYKKDDQVFFCYGRLSNTLLLQRYGFSLKHNKYEKCFIYLYVGQFLQEYPDFLQMYQLHSLPAYKSYKLKRVTFNTDLIVLLRLQKWRVKNDISEIFYAYDLDVQLQIFQQIIQIYQRQISKFKYSPQQYNQKIKDKSIGYSQYFANIYKIAKLDILITQLKLCRVCVAILSNLQKSLPLNLAKQGVNDLQSQLEKKICLKMIQNYLEMLKMICL